MQTYRRFSTLRQLAAGFGVFAVLGLLLDSGGLYNWAQGLELGPERTIALPAATALHGGLVRLGIEKGRQQLLGELTHLGWSDLPEEPAMASTPQSTSAALPLVVPPVKASTPMSLGGTVKHASPSLPLAGAPPLYSNLPLIPGVTAGHRRTIALAGDSMMAVGLSPVIMRQAVKYKGLVFVPAFKSGTGLARPEVFNWQTEYSAMLKTNRPEIILVAIGANDGQGFVDEGVTYPFGTEGWQRVYQARVAAYLQMLQADGATVIWIGLPPMKSGKFNERIALVNRIQYTVVTSSTHAIWFSTGGTVGDSDGQFRDFAEVGNHTVRLRQNDGIHLSDDGATLLTAKLLPWLAKEEEVVKPQQAIAAAVEASDR